MRITKFRKFITWNIVSLIGYIGLIIACYFVILITLSASNFNMRADLNEIYMNFTINHVFLPYISAYKFQMTMVFTLLLFSIYENYHYKTKGLYGLRLFSNHEIGYSVIFTIGLALNFCPLYLFSMFLLHSLRNLH